MRSLYLVRHGKPQYPDEHSYCVGQTDFSLSMLGHLQAVLLNEELSDKISGIYCSPLLRAVETAGHMSPELPHIIAIVNINRTSVIIIIYTIIPSACPSELTALTILLSLIGCSPAMAVLISVNS